MLHCSRFLQGPDTDRNSVLQLKAAIKQGKEVTVRLLNYRKDGTPFWNMLTVAPIRDVAGAPRFLVGVQVDVTAKPTPEEAAPEGMSAATQVGLAVRTMDWVGVDPWAGFLSGVASPKPHHAGDPAEAALRDAIKKEGKIRLRLFQRLRQLGSGDVGMVDLVSLASRGNGGGVEYKFALKSLEKQEMMDRNKIGRVKTEEQILADIDHPFLARCYAQLQTDTHLHFLLEFCSGGELYALLNSQPGKRLPESAVKFYAVEVLLALQYLHLKGFAYRDLKPENILLHESGHIKLTDFDLSYALGQTKPSWISAAQVPMVVAMMKKRKNSSSVASRNDEASNGTATSTLSTATTTTTSMTTTTASNLPSGTSIPSPKNNEDTTTAAMHDNLAATTHAACGSAEEDLLLCALPEGRANSFVGTEEYLAPEIISGSGHDAMVDWWSFGILLYELLYGTTPFRGTRRDGTFDNVLKKPLVFPGTPEVSVDAKDLITALLIKDPKMRLGAVAGADEVKRHPWFAEVNWALAREQTPPFMGGKKFRDVSGGGGSMEGKGIEGAAKNGPGHIDGF